MSWNIKYKKEAHEFLVENELIDKFERKIRDFLKGVGSVHIKKLSGKLEGHYRLRMGKIRIILKFIFENKVIYVKKADFRGDVYK